MRQLERERADREYERYHASEQEKANRKLEQGRQNKATMEQMLTERSERLAKQKEQEREEDARILRQIDRRQQADYRREMEERNQFKKEMSNMYTENNRKLAMKRLEQERERAEDRRMMEEYARRLDQQEAARAKAISDLANIKPPEATVEANRKHEEAARRDELRWQMNMEEAQRRAVLEEEKNQEKARRLRDEMTDALDEQIRLKDQMANSQRSKDKSDMERTMYEISLKNKRDEENAQRLKMRNLSYREQLDQQMKEQQERKYRESSNAFMTETEKAMNRGILQRSMQSPRNNNGSPGMTGLAQNSPRLSPRRGYMTRGAALGGKTFMQ